MLYNDWAEINLKVIAQVGLQSNAIEQYTGLVKQRHGKT